ncbi:TnsA endonuclease N terminal [Geosporobacter subterraneus DSM 17957]|uniref:TnsA endonuclease N terminal n=1 Tax=Geosporobacter subterraneus DSM 17957 TaxID=1121919 RepID=A0A1M6QSR4_9FIRM|nr:TnsA endonuclease N terminal [Geosporobacter subterraneus DSM 17957]
MLARTIKSVDNLNSQRQMEKFEIERCYWKMKDIDWGIVTEKEIDKNLTDNIGLVRPFYSLDCLYGFLRTL